MLRLDEPDADTAFVGYILGGIQSSQPNIFFINTGVESVAANRLFKVYLVQNAASSTQTAIQENPLKVSAVPNPFRDEMQVTFETARLQKIGVRILDAGGKKVLRIPEQEYPAGKHRIPVTLKWFPKGAYTVLLFEQGKIIANCQIIKS